MGLTKRTKLQQERKPSGKRAARIHLPKTKEKTVKIITHITGPASGKRDNVGTVAQVLPNTFKWGKKGTNLPKPAKTRVGNRKVFLMQVDERHWRMRRSKELYFGILNDLGGVDYISPIQDNLAKSLAFLIMLGEELMAQQVNDDPEFDLIVYIAYLKTAVQIGRALGLKRVKRPINPDGDLAGGDTPETLEEYLEQQEKVFKKQKKAKARKRKREAGKKPRTIDVPFKEVVS